VAKRISWERTKVADAASPRATQASICPNSVGSTTPAASSFDDASSQHKGLLESVFTEGIVWSDTRKMTP
jgi:hypothetical protein